MTVNKPRKILNQAFKNVYVTPIIIYKIGAFWHVIFPGKSNLTRKFITEKEALKFTHQYVNNGFCLRICENPGKYVDDVAKNQVVKNFEDNATINKIK